MECYRAIDRDSIASAFRNAIPDRLLEYREILHYYFYEQRHDRKGRAVVYFLVDRKRVVYVGQTTALAPRIKAHVADSKVFSDAFYIDGIPDHLALSLEAFFIRSLRPLFNRETMLTDHECERLIGRLLEARRDP